MALLTCTFNIVTVPLFITLCQSLEGIIHHQCIHLCSCMLSSFSNFDTVLIIDCSNEWSIVDTLHCYLENVEFLELYLFFQKKTLYLYVCIYIYIYIWGRRVIGISKSLIWSKTLMALIFNTLVNFGEVWRAQLAKSTLLTSMLVPLGCFQIFWGLCRC